MKDNFYRQIANSIVSYRDLQGYEVAPYSNINFGF